MKDLTGMENEIERISEMVDELKSKGFAVVPLDPTQPIIDEIRKIGGGPKDWKNLLNAAGSL